MAEGKDALQEWFDRKRDERINELREMATRRTKTTSDGSAASSSIDAVRELMEATFAKSGSDSSQNEPRPQPEMQQAILVEVRGLFETRPVTNMLHSPNFRRELEGIVRASVNAARETHSRTEPSLSSSSGPSSVVPLPRPAPRQIVSQPQTGVTSSVPSPPSPRVPRQTAPQPQAVQSSHNSAPPPPLPLQSAPDSRTSLSVPNNTRFVDQLQHEQLVVDISDLLHTRLVSSTLSSNFRDELEHLMQSNFVNPERARNSIQALSQLPPSNHVRNDFSHLGIHNPALVFPGDSESDSVSIISAAAARVPVSQTNFGIGREMAAMRAEMKEMQKMLKMVLDMQSDLHRAVRQEVAAAMAVSSQEASSYVIPSSRPTQMAGRCLICLDSRADTMAYRCGHLCMCNSCALSLGQHQGRRHTCPVCRAPIQDLVRVYVSEQ